MQAYFQDILFGVILALVVILVVFTIYNHRLKDFREDLIDDVNLIFSLNGREVELLEKYSKAFNETVKSESVEGISVNNEERRKQLVLLKMKIRNCL